MDGDLSAVVRAGTGGSSGLMTTAGSSNKVSLLDMIDMDLSRRQNTNKLVVESGSCSFTSGSTSPSSVLQCTSSLLLSDLSKCRGEETLADVCQQSFTYNKTSPSPYYSSGAGALDSPRKSFNSFSAKADAVPIVERIPEVLSRNLQRRDQQQLSHAAASAQLQRKDILADMHALSRTRPRSRTMGSSLIEGGRPAGSISQENIKEDFFQGGSNSSSFNQRSTTSQCGSESISSEHGSNSRQSSPGRDEPTHHVAPLGPVKKIEHSLSVKIEESSAADDQFSPGGSKAPKRRLAISLVTESHRIQLHPL